MKNRSCQLNMTKVPWTFRHPLSTRLTLEVTVDGAHSRIHQSAHLWLMGSLVHNLWMFYLGHGNSFLFDPTS